MKQTIKALLAIGMACTLSPVFATEPVKENIPSIVYPTPGESIGGAVPVKICRIPGVLTIHPNGHYICRVNTNKACVFYSCPQGIESGTTGTSTGDQLTVLPRGIEVPEGQPFIGYFDEGNVFQLIYVNSVTVTEDAASHTVDLQVNR